jgi:hypothetical protein
MSETTGTYERLEVDREFSEEGIARIFDLGVSRLSEAHRIWIELTKMPRISHSEGRWWESLEDKGLQSKHDEALRLAADTILIGKTLDEVVPIHGGLHWFDLMQGEAEARIAAESE